MTQNEDNLGLKPRNDDRRSGPRGINKERRAELSENKYEVNPDYSDEIEIVEDKSLGITTPLSQVIKERELLARNQAVTGPDELENLKSILRSEIINELGQQNSIASLNEMPHYSPDTDIIVIPTAEEAQVEIKPFLKKRRPGRPSSLPNESESNDWPRKTYRFQKNTLKRLKIHQAGLDDHQDLSILINEALKHWLNQQEDA